MKLNLMQQKELEIMKEVKRHGGKKWDYLTYLTGISDANIWLNIGW